MTYVYYALTFNVNQTHFSDLDLKLTTISQETTVLRFLVSVLKWLLSEESALEVIS